MTSKRETNAPEVDQVWLHVMNQIERFEAIIARLREIGVLDDRDMAIVDVRLELRATELHAVTNRGDGDEAAAAASEQEAVALESRLRTLEALDSSAETRRAHRSDSKH